jgi:hypothetical protein
VALGASPKGIAFDWTSVWVANKNDDRHQTLGPLV